MNSKKLSVALTLVLFIGALSVMGRPTEEVKSGSLVTKTKITGTNAAVKTSYPVSTESVETASEKNAIPVIQEHKTADVAAKVEASNTEEGAGSNPNHRHAKCFGYKGVC